MAFISIIFIEIYLYYKYFSLMILYSIFNILHIKIKNKTLNLYMKETFSSLIFFHLILVTSIANVIDVTDNF
jgi:hypothetical protein